MTLVIEPDSFLSRMSAALDVRTDRCREREVRSVTEHGPLKEYSADSCC